MDSPQQQHQHRFFKALFVFENTMNTELVRSLHVYGFENGKDKQVEREFLFKEKGPYVEMVANPILRLRGFQVSELFEGRVIGLWLCIFAFRAAEFSPSFINFPPKLSISRNPKLKSIPKLANDLQMIFQLSCRTEYQEPLKSTADEMHELHETHIDRRRRRPERSPPLFCQDLNCFPNSVARCEDSGSQQIEQCATGNMDKKKKRAASQDVARIDLKDLEKYFDLPILEASKNLNVGLTVLKKKCREFGIPRWPHRKIKSLDGLIHELQEVGRQKPEDEDAAMAVERRRQMLEEEKESIERKPFMEIQKETKKFRQDIFKRRHKARALKMQN
ncbi:RWP-RK domain containing protein [Melia azedarach]|uniref:RWP-RK domain containing protein n=1 Tax=Melia azedarach TaxID=155640 RepID=A0ACC1XSC1_MELAZ|nr:RWP-RK domain containing protein [Melia azedarach]